MGLPFNFDEEVGWGSEKASKVLSEDAERHPRAVYGVGAPHR